MNCPTCGTEIDDRPAPLLTIRGKPMQVVKRTATKKQYIWISDEEVLHTVPIPILIVEEA